MMNLDLLIPKDAPSGGTWTWARVSNFVSAGTRVIRVLLDGESHPDYVEGSALVWMCDPQEFALPSGTRSDRTMVQLVDGKVLVYSNGQGLPRVSESELTDGTTQATSGRMLWTSSGGPALNIGDGGSSWWEFAPTSGGSTSWRTTLAGYYASGPPQGMTFYDTDLGQLMVWDGAAWIPFAPVQSADWIDIPLASGYEAGETGTPQYCVKNGWVSIRGSIQESATGNLSLNSSPGHTIGTLPVEARPIGGDIVNLVPPQNPANNQARMFVWTNGTVKIYLTGSGAAAYVSLSATYPI